MGSIGKPSSVCVLRLTALGDCINAYGMIRSIQLSNPETEILWIIDSRFAALFRDADGKDLIPLLPVDFKKGTLHAVNTIRLALKGRHFDALLNMQTSLKASLCSLAVRAKHKLGYDKERSREGQCFFINHKVPSPANPHVLAGFMAFAREAGLGSLQPQWNFKLDERELAPYRKRFSGLKIFTIAPASAKAQKNWTVAGYVELAQYAISKGFTVALVGGKAQKELDLCADIASKLDEKDCINLCGQTNLRELACVLLLSALVLAPDSASMHLASALGTPVIGLFAVHNPKRVGSWKFPELWVSVYHKIAAKECGSKKHIPWRYRVRDEQAMSKITPAAVKKTFDLALDHYLLED